MIFNMVGGGAGGAGGGATLVVSSPANVSVTVSKDDKSYTKNSGSLGSTTFKGLATGTWAVTISGNGQTATRTIEITADYAITIAFFSATINITYPANSNCVVTNSGGQTVASDTNTTSSEKTFTAIVNATGTYTVTATAADGSGNSKSQSVSITADGQSESVTLSYITYYYKAGDQCTDVTGGWETKVYSSVYATFNADNIYISSGNSQPTGFCGTDKAVDLSKVNTLQATVVWDADSDSPKMSFFTTDSVSDNMKPDVQKTAYVDKTSDFSGNVTIDVSSLSSGVIAFSCYHGKLTVTEVRALD